MKVWLIILIRQVSVILKDHVRGININYTVGFIRHIVVELLGKFYCVFGRMGLLACNCTEGMKDDWIY